MISRRGLLASAVPALAIARQTSTKRFGVELYSLRGMAERDFPGTLAFLRKLGVSEVEVSELYGHPATEVRRMLDAAGVRATSMMADYRRLDKECDAVARDARVLGAEFVVCSTIPHRTKYLSVEDCADAAPRLNAWGEQLKGSGLSLCYHTHGTEFRKAGEGTVFDVLAEKTNPRYANFEMDIFWIVYGYQDPVKMLKKYPGRFPLMHVKDIRKGTPLGGSPADVREEDSVPLGQGIVDIPAALQAAEKAGVRHYYIEDEAVDADKQLPLSLQYLRKL